MALVAGRVSNSIKCAVVAGKYCLESIIDSGSFGQIYSGVDQTSGEKVAVKLESIFAPLPILHLENKIYRSLAGGEGFSRAYWYGQHNDFNLLVMDQLGPSLDNLLHKCYGKFSLKTVTMLALQMIERIEYLHKKNFIHRDIKPDNFLLGNGKHSATVFLIDFGLSKKFRDSKTFGHIQMQTNKELIGSFCFCSVNTHQGLEQSRRDDMLSLGYVIIYLLQGKLPWQDLNIKDIRQKCDEIYKIKLSTTVEILCKDSPQEFADYFNYCTNLQFAETPDYCYIRQLFRNIFKRMNFKLLNLKYDWMI